MKGLISDKMKDRECGCDKRDCDCNKKDDCCGQKDLNYCGDDISCIGVKKGDKYKDVIQNIGEAVCGILDREDGESPGGDCDYCIPEPPSDDDTYGMNNGEWVKVDKIDGSCLEKTLSEVLEDVSNKSLVSCAMYKITGVHRGHQAGSVYIESLYDDGTDSGITIFLRAVSSTKLETKGSGVFYNPKYDKNKSGYSIWNEDDSYNVDDVVFWGGYAWKNLNGNIGSAVDNLNLDGEWDKLDYSSSFYKEVIDVIEYDIGHDVITRRVDTRNDIDVRFNINGIVSYFDKKGVGRSTISFMQWGNDLSGGLGCGKIDVRDFSFFNNINSYGSYSINSLDNSYLFRNTIDDDVVFKGNSFRNSFFYNISIEIPVGDGFEGNTFLNTVMRNSSISEDFGFKNNSFTNSEINNSQFSKGTYFIGNTLINSGISGLHSTYNVNNNTFINSKIFNIRIGLWNLMNNKFINFNADFDNIDYIGIPSTGIYGVVFEGVPTTTYTIPNLSSATIIFDPSKTQKRVFDDGSGNLKIQYFDGMVFQIADITD